MRIKIKGNNNQVALNGNINNIMISTYKLEEFVYKPPKTKNIFASKILELIHQINKYEPDFSLEELAYILEFNSVSELTKYFNTNKEPSYAFLDKLADKLYISKEWLKFSRGNIFDGESLKTFWLTDFYKDLENLTFKNIYILISDNSKYQEALILIQRKKYIYQKYYKRIPLYQGIGAAGKGELYEFYLFLKKIYKKHEWNNKITEYLLPERIFNSIICGNLYPGSIYKEKIITTYFCDDLLDLNHQYFTKDRYLEMYGENFLACQQNIIERINKESKIAIAKPK